MENKEEILAAIREDFDESSYPQGFIDGYDRLECLADARGAETYIVKDKRSSNRYVARCYSKSLYTAINEDGILKSLSSPGLPVFRESFENEEMKVIVRQYIEGQPLDVYAAENALDNRGIVALCLELCDILAYLHGCTPPVIHRDIKPQNIIVRPDGHITLIDFDISRRYRDDAESDTLFFGTRAYAPPEQYGFSQTDCRADIYSFGVLLRYMLTGSPRENKNIRFYRPLEKIVAKCTAFAPKERYGSISAVKKALLAANPRSRFLRGALVSLCALLVCGALGFGGLKLYEYLTFDPFADGNIPAVMQDEERVADAIDYLHEKYNTALFDDTDSYVTVGIIKDALVELYGMDYDYAHTPSPLDPPQENPDCFFPWSLGDEQCVDRNYMAYFVTKIYWPEVVADWSSLREDTGEYPGVRVSVAWCEEHGILTGVKRPQDITQGEAAIALANADRVFEALKNE